MENAPLLQVEKLKKYYGRGKQFVPAVNDVSFSIAPGETFALVGESGCGKSTTGRMVLRLGGPLTGGSVCFQGQDIYALNGRQLRKLRPKMQMVFQDPMSSLTPRMPVGELILEPVAVHGLVEKKERQDYLYQIMEQCGLAPYHAGRYPHEFSGGQRQRISIARALALQPEFVVCDEPVSALDVSVQAQIVNLLMELQEKRRLGYLFISHDLSVVDHMANRVGVMYAGKLVEVGSRGDIFDNPCHPYTRMLFSSLLPATPGGKRLYGDLIPAVYREGLPGGCPFYSRCPRRVDACLQDNPALLEITPGHWCACHKPG